MSDMIDRLTKLSREAGTNAAHAMTGRSTLDSMEARIHRGVRRRRQRIGAVTAAAVLIAGGGGILAPQLLNDVDLPQPPAEAPRVVSSDNVLTVYEDGSMSVVRANGRIVNVPAVDVEDATRFTTLTSEIACTPPDLDAFSPGWEYVDSAYTQLIQYGRNYSQVPGEDLRAMRQGELITIDHHASQTVHGWPALAFQVEADPAVAEHLVTRATVHYVGQDGVQHHYQSWLSAHPSYEVQGDPSLGTAVALVQTGPNNTVGYCKSAYEDASSTPSSFRRYMTVEVFLTDRDGSAALLGTHRSWSGIEVSP